MFAFTKFSSVDQQPPGTCEVLSSGVWCEPKKVKADS